MTTVANVCTSVTVPSGTTGTGTGTGSSSTTLYDCLGKAAALRAAGATS
jgi:hypothetical protein